MAWIASFSRKILCTLANICVAVLGSTALVLVANDYERPEHTQTTSTTAPRRLVPCGKQDWKRTIRRGVGLGVGLVLLVAGVVRQTILEKRDLEEWFVAARLPRDKPHSGTFYGSPILRFAVYTVLFGLFNSSNDYDDINDDDVVNDDQDEDQDDDDNIDINFSTTLGIRPMEDDSDGAERPTHGDDRTFIIRTDTMVTIRDAIASATREIGISDIGIFVEEQTNNENGGNDGDSDGDYDQLLTSMISIEHEDSATAPYSDGDIPSQ